MLTELGKVLTQKGFDHIADMHSDKEPATMGFGQPDGSIKRYKVVRIDRENKKIWAEPITLMTEDEMVKHVSEKIAKRVKRKGKK